MSVFGKIVKKTGS